MHSHDEGRAARRRSSSFEKMELDSRTSSPKHRDKKSKSKKDKDKSAKRTSSKKKASRSNSKKHDREGGSEEEKLRLELLQRELDEEAEITETALMDIALEKLLVMNKMRERAKDTLEMGEKSVSKKISSLQKQNESLRSKNEMIQLSLLKMKTKNSLVEGDFGYSANENGQSTSHSPPGKEEMSIAQKFFVEEREKQLLATKERVQKNLDKYDANIAIVKQNCVHGLQFYLCENKRKRLFINCINKAIIKLKKTKNMELLKEVLKIRKKCEKDTASTPKFHVAAGAFLSLEDEVEIRQRNAAARKIQRALVTNKEKKHSKKHGEKLHGKHSKKEKGRKSERTHSGKKKREKEKSSKGPMSLDQMVNSKSRRFGRRPGHSKAAHDELSVSNHSNASEMSDASAMSNMSAMSGRSSRSMMSMRSARSSRSTMSCRTPRDLRARSKSRSRRHVGGIVDNSLSLLDGAPDPLRRTKSSDSNDFITKMAMRQTSRRQSFAGSTSGDQSVGGGSLRGGRQRRRSSVGGLSKPQSQAAVIIQALVRGWLHRKGFKPKKESGVVYRRFSKINMDDLVSEADDDDNCSIYSERSQMSQMSQMSNMSSMSQMSKRGKDRSSRNVKHMQRAPSRQNEMALAVDKLPGKRGKKKKSFMNIVGRLHCGKISTSKKLNDRENETEATSQTAVN